MTEWSQAQLTKVNKNTKFKNQRHQQFSFQLELGMLAKAGYSLFNQVLKCLSELTVDMGGGKASSKILFLIFEQETSKLDTVGFPPDSVSVYCGPHWRDWNLTA